MTVDFTLVILVLAPCLFIGLISYFSIQSMLKKQLLQQKFQLIKANQKQGIPIKLQAYERFTLLLDRISLSKLLVRVAPVGDNIDAYKHLLLATIDQEFEHNTTQQIYISDDCWSAIVSAKSTVISQLHQLGEQESIKSTNQFREEGLKKYASTSSANQIAQSFIRNEVRELFGE